MSDPIHVPPENVKPISGENQLMGAFQELIIHYLQWNRKVAEGTHQDKEFREKWDSQLGELLSKFKEGLNQHIDERVQAQKS